MHPWLPLLAKKLGTQIVSRDAWETYLYDGATIADHYWIRPDPKDPVEFPAEKISYDDVALLHELGHLVAASPEQRDLPEYGMALGIADGSGYGPAGGEFRHLDGKLRTLSPEVFAGLVDTPEQDIQESLAQLLSIFWGRRYGVPFWMRDWNLTVSWEFYYEYKILKNDGKPHSRSTQARVRLAQERAKLLIDSWEDP